MREIRLIDANALAESDIAKIIDQYLYNQCNLTVGLAAALMPTIEAKPVKHGRWILCKDQYNVDNDNGNYAYYCSRCKHQDIHAESAKVSFCWNCGADMRERKVSEDGTD